VRDRYDRAATSAEESLRLRREIGETPTLPHSLDLLGSARRHLGDLPAALEAHQEGLRIAREEKNDLQEGFLLMLLARGAQEDRLRPLLVQGKCRLAEGVLDEAQRLLEQALDQARNLSRKDREAEVRTALAESAEKLGRRERAAAHLKDAAEQYREIASRIED